MHTTRLTSGRSRSHTSPSPAAASSTPPVTSSGRACGCAPWASTELVTTTTSTPATSANLTTPAP
ncbi:hypothetical protein [Sinosporangium siamense]|uniref:hypothetical protein n=1 Tax=Sinosporangium siamense TaxID=1367973 RepID=UPI00194E5A4F|nr:hypothetical protein [Sinosporangium siamense]